MPAQGGPLHLHLKSPSAPPADQGAYSTLSHAANQTCQTLVVAEARSAPTRYGLPAHLIADQTMSLTQWKTQLHPHAPIHHRSQPQELLQLALQRPSACQMSLPSVHRRTHRQQSMSTRRSQTQHLRTDGMHPWWTTLMLMCCLMIRTL